MAIQWFPGHMHKARKEMAQVLPATDVIIEVLDARIPFSSENPMLESLRGSKPCLKVLAKSDLADLDATDLWLSELETETTKAISVNSTDSSTIAGIQPMLSTMVTRSQSRVSPFVVMIVGIPNVGKSTLINAMAGRSVAKTGNEPAITKRQQNIVLSDNWVLRDTPGVLWPNVENPHSGFRLAATGAIRDTAMDSADVAAHLLDYLCVHYADQLSARYGQDLPLHDSIATLEAIGTKRGCIGAGKMVDFDRAARLLLTEYRAGQIGNTTLETPQMKSYEQEAVKIARIEKEAKKAERKTRRKTSRRSKQ